MSALLKNSGGPSSLLAPTCLRVIPLGGVGTFGMNCTVFECEGSMIVVDVGVKIPQGNLPGVDLILPDLSYIIENEDSIQAVFLTHGHDDHIGAVSYLLEQLDVPVYGTAFTLAMARNRLEESADNGNVRKADLRQMLFGQTIECGPFSVEPVRVTHSIPDSAALCVKTPVGTVLHSGDFRMEQHPLDGHPTDMGRLTELGDEGILLLMSDSTNADRPGWNNSERDVKKALEDVMSRAEGRVFIATFASHIHRIQMILDTAQSQGRRVLMEGRRLLQNCRTASELGYILYPPRTLVEFDDLDAKEKKKAVFLTTGTQGEPLSALSRIVRDEHPRIAIEQGDTVIFSSRTIPGNELPVGQIINEVYRRGARVVTRGPEMVHVSGHSSAEEIKLFIEALRPKFFVPVHGDFRQMRANADLAAGSGVSTKGILILEPGQVLELAESSASMGEPVAAGRLLVDGETVGDVDTDLLRDRRRLAREGLVVVVAGVGGDGSMSFKPMVHSVGVGMEDAAEGLDEAAVGEVEKVLERSRALKVNRDDIKEEIRILVRRIYKKALQKKPRVVTVIVEE